ARRRVLPSFPTRRSSDLTEASTSTAATLGTVITVRLTGPEDLRRQRALARDPGYAPWWEMWAAQECEHFAGPGDVPVDHVLGWRSEEHTSELQSRENLVC